MILWCCESVVSSCGHLRVLPLVAPLAFLWTKNKWLVGSGGTSYIGYIYCNGGE